MYMYLLMLQIMLGTSLILLVATLLGFRISNVYVDMNSYGLCNFEIMQQNVAVLGYNMFYCVSLCQIQVNKLTSYFKRILLLCEPWYKSLKQFLKDKGIIIEVVINIFRFVDNNGNYMHSIIFQHNSSLETIELWSHDVNYSNIILTDVAEEVDTNCKNYVWYDKFPSSLDYKVSNVKFMAIDLTHENNTYPIILKDEWRNYYIVNNSLNQNFFKYYCKNILKININEDKFDYDVKIIDHNVNLITISQQQYITFEETDYKIYNIGEDNHKCVKEANVNEEQSAGSDSDKSDDFIKLDNND